MFIELDTEVFTCNDQIVVIIFCNYRGYRGNIYLFNICQFQFRSLIRADNQLVFSNRISRRKHCFRFFQFESDIQQQFLAFADSVRSIVQLYRFGLLRSHFQIFDHACLNYFAISQQFPFCIITTQITEEVFVINIHDTACQVRRSYPDRLVNMSDLMHMRIRLTVRTDQTIVQEVIIRCIVAVKVATVSIIFHTFLIFHTQ